MADIVVTPSVAAPISITPVSAVVNVQALATGPAGPAGAGFTHNQSSASALWTINHNLGFRPSVTIFNSGGAEIEADVAHPTINQTQIAFSTALSGSARLT